MSQTANDIISDTRMNKPQQIEVKENEVPYQASTDSQNYKSNNRQRRRRAFQRSLGRRPGLRRRMDNRPRERTRTNIRERRRDPFKQRRGIRLVVRNLARNVSNAELKNLFQKTCEYR